jgi:hypothetical protein
VRDSDPARDGRLARYAPVPLGVLLGGALLAPALRAAVAFPTHTDQDGYLQAGHDFVAGFHMLERAPLYSIWMGLFHLIGGGDPTRVLFLEKLASTLLLGALTGWAAALLFGGLTGGVLAFWAIDAKYLFLEPNGSHVLAAALLMLGVAALLARGPSRWPLALLAIFFAAQVRSEMSVVLLLFVGISLWRAGVRRELRRDGAVRVWVGCIILAGLFLGLSHSRASGREPERYAVAFGQNFAVNYLEIHSAMELYPTPWSSYREVWSRFLPRASDSIGSTTLGNTLRHYPEDVLRHFAHNARLAVRALPAMIVPSHPLRLLLIVVLACAVRFSWIRRSGPRISDWRRLPETRRQEIETLFICSLALVPLSLVFRVAARYYLPLLPMELLAIPLAIQRLAPRLRVSAADRFRSIARKG